MSQHEFIAGDRIVVIAGEPDSHIRDTGGEIPVGTTGEVIRYSGSDMNPGTGEKEPFVTCVFDLPYTGNKNHCGHLGLIKFDVFESMIAPIDKDIGEYIVGLEEFFE